MEQGERRSKERVSQRDGSSEIRGKMKIHFTFLPMLQDCEQIEPKKLPNPHKESKQHVKLNKEIKLNNAL